MKSLPVVIREERRRRGLLQRELAERATAERKKIDPYNRERVNPTYLSKIENGRGEAPSVELTQAILRALDINMEDEQVAEWLKASFRRHGSTDAPFTPLSAYLSSEKSELLKAIDDGDVERAVSLASRLAMRNRPGS
jgi:transcriptional regulator with XRE-family HTH domain